MPIHKVAAGAVCSVTGWGTFIALLATAAGVESVFLSAINYVSVGVIALVIIYVMFKMHESACAERKVNQDHMQTIVAEFTKTMDVERTQRENIAHRVEEKVNADHNLCRLDHQGLMESLDRIGERQAEIVNSLKVLCDQCPNRKHQP